MRILWISPLLLPSACRAMGWPEPVRGGWVQAQLDALLARYDTENEYCILSLDGRKCDVATGNVRHRSFGEGVVTYGRSVPRNIENEAQKAICEFAPDVIHIHGTEFFYGRMRKEIYCGKPVVVSVQGVLAGCLPFIDGALSAGDVFRDKFNLQWLLKGNSVSSMAEEWRSRRVPQEEQVFRPHRHFIGRTDWDRAWTKALNPDAVYHHVNETLRGEFYSCKRRRRDSIVPHSIYCSAAAGYPLKGAHVLLRAVAILKRKYPDVSVHVCAAAALMPGRTSISRLKDGQWVRHLRRLIRGLGIAGNVVAYPNLDAAEVARRLASAEAFVLPSFCENSPNSLGEAQLAGTPVVASFAGGIPSLVRNGIDGLLVPPGDSAALADAIDRLFTRPGEADAFASAARETAIVRHDPVRNAEATMDVYREVCADAAVPAKESGR